MRAYEAEQPSYFATPNTSLVRALEVSLRSIVEYGIEKRVADHIAHSHAFQAAMSAIGLKQLAETHRRANTLSALYYPDGIDTSKFIPSVLSSGIVCAGGLHKDVKAKYFRVGHMGVSIDWQRDDLKRTVAAIERALAESGYKFEQGKAVAVYEEQLNKEKKSSSAVNGASHTGNGKL